MILTILFGVLFVAGIVLGIVFWERIEAISFIGAFVALCSSIGFICCGVISICNNVPVSHVSARIKYTETVTSLNSTYKLLTQAEDSYAKYTAIQQYNVEVEKFKTDILSTQHQLKNPWLNWMNNYEYNNFDANVVSYIEVE